MKIGMISLHPASEGGVASYTKNLVLNLQKNGIEVTVFAEKVEKAQEPEKHNSFQINACWRKGIFYPFQIFKNLCAYKDLEVIHIQHEFFLFGNIFAGFLFPILLVLITLMRKPVIVTLHGVIPLSEINARFKKENNITGPTIIVKTGLLAITKIILVLSTAVIVHEKFFKTILCREYKCPKKKIKVISHGIENVEIKISKEKAKNYIGFKDEKIILFFGYIAKYKGIETLIEAFKILGKKRNNLVLFIVGGSHPRLRKKVEYKRYVLGLKQSASSSELKKRIFFTGFIPEVKIPLYFAAADVVVLPYTTAMSSSGPMAYAIAYERPLLVSNIPSFTSKIKVRESLFEKNNPKELASKLEKLLVDENLQRTTIQEIKRVKLENSWSVVGKRTCCLYEKIVKNYKNHFYGDKKIEP
jgi:glycosyltransferase involved in cell wall biosynthesis